MMNNKKYATPGELLMTRMLLDSDFDEAANEVMTDALLALEERDLVGAHVAAEKVLGLSDTIQQRLAALYIKHLSLNPEQIPLALSVAYDV